MNTVPIQLRLPRSLHDQALALQAEEQKGTARRVKLAPILVDLLSAGIRGNNDDLLLQQLLIAEHDVGQALGAEHALLGYPEPMHECDDAWAKAVGPHAPQVSEAINRGIRMGTQKFSRLLEGRLAIVRAQARTEALAWAATLAGDFDPFDAAWPEGTQQACERTLALFAEKLSREARGLDALASVVPQMDPPFVAEFGPIPTAFTHRMDAAGQTHRWPDDSPAWQVLWCRGVGPSARRDRVGDGWGEWSVVMPPLPVPEVK